MPALFVTLAVAASSLLLVVRTVHVVLATPKLKIFGPPDPELWEVAFLSGGPARVADAAIAGMHQDGRLAVGGPGVVSVRQAVAHDPVETAVLDSLARTPDGSLGTLRRHVMRAPAVQAIGDRLAKRGQMRHPRTGRPWRRLAGWQAGICAAGFLLVLLFTLIGAIDSRGSGVPFVVRILPAAFVGIVVGGVCRRVLGRRVTRAGVSAVRKFRTANAARLVSDPTQSAALIVALGSTALLVDDVLRDHLVEAQGSAAGASAGAYSGTSSTASSSSSNASCGWNVPDDGWHTSWCGTSCGGGSGSSCGSSSCGGGSSSCSGGSSSCGSSSGSSCSSSSSSCGGGGCGGS
ncbi:TIGR04222 domain-containing membrane protein [Streptomyces sp. CB02923]|uniref:TIGR04222 domain-containing membrane protein n=1 Tax=Streptomyces sp. CB02923 TaxID=1718985 RepID=UPI000AE74F24|nr:TIGR04222 domain-containing membrane protein [Streptomyces sp. CB02923]